MNRTSVLAGSALVGALALVFVEAADPIRKVDAPAPVVFVCRNGVAMSVWSAAYFNRLAAARGLNERAIARATVPSFRAVPWNMTLALALDGFRLDDYRPEVISDLDVEDAELVVAIDTELPLEVPSGTVRTETWQGFPPMREQYFPSRTALKRRVEELVERLAATTPHPEDTSRAIGATRWAAF